MELWMRGSVSRPQGIVVRAPRRRFSARQASPAGGTAWVFLLQGVWFEVIWQLLQSRLQLRDRLGKLISFLVFARTSQAVPLNAQVQQVFLQFQG
ncbi:hypothetical protein H4B96_04215 [Pseudomonas juntendi]|uniref:Uncharacterized protein n=1 Tax=Pseudomonas juntendi TaxID=2666183 RepID=A0A7W2LSH5_9PSED|nr:hypothetical protein [Pseudomonas juntendi]MBA6146223.1 hypothetical protein [Pseudomonas juntendi]NOY02789.1 hypothetical protein [Gammaproteobacteria bacterium]NPA17621.1 hypothetical protein [Gammaproteobacteria bacterium]